MKKLFVFIVIPVLFFASCTNSGTSEIDEAKKIENEKIAHAKELLTKAQSSFKAIVEDKEKAVDSVQQAKINLGKILFFDNRLSNKETQSCNTCHNLETYGVDNQATSAGDNKGLGNRNSPTVIYAALHGSQFWDGRAKDVEEQAGMPITNPVEMAIPSEKFLVDRLTKITGYKALFKTAFPDAKQAITYENIRIAIASFERTLAPVSRFDKYLTGDSTALNESEIKGLETFMNAGCTSCHSGIAVGGDLLMKFGVHAEYAPLTGSKTVDNGKFEVSKDENDRFVFKSQSLRNIEKTGPYFHDGSVASLDKAIEIMGKTQLGKDLTPEEISEISTFLKTLTAELNAETKTAPEMPK